MLSRFLMIAMLLVGLTVPAAKAAHTWDLALNGGWMRVLVDFDLPSQTVFARLNDTRPGGNQADIAESVLIDRGSFLVLQGQITTGTFKIGLGAKEFTVGDRFFLFIDKYTENVTLVLVDRISVADSYTTKLTYF